MTQRVTYVRFSKDPILTQGGEGGFEEGKREGNVLLTLLLKSIKDPARLQWHEVKKVDHYYLSIDAVTQPMQVREETIPYGDGKK